MITICFLLFFSQARNLIRTPILPAFLYLAYYGLLFSSCSKIMYLKSCEKRTWEWNICYFEADKNPKSWVFLNLLILIIVKFSRDTSCYTYFYFFQYISALCVHMYLNACVCLCCLCVLKRVGSARFSYILFPMYLFVWFDLFSVLVSFTGSTLQMFLIVFKKITCRLVIARRSSI